jgi:hypothetical protein
MGLAVFDSTKSIILLTGIARDDAALRENRRCVINSAWMNRGYSSSNVVSLTPSGEIESAITFAEMFPLPIIISPKKESHPKMAQVPLPII